MTEAATPPVLLLTTSVGGADGISALSRQYVDALVGPHAGLSVSLEVWSLNEAAAPAGLPAGVTFRGAAGRRWRFAALGLQACLRVPAGMRVVVLHAHLLPVTLPLWLAGARVVAVLVGVEVWSRVRGLQAFILRRAWRRLSISAATRDRFRRANPRLASLPVEVCAPALTARADVAPLPGPSSPEPFALIVGRMVAAERYKGHDALLDVWPAVRRAVPGAVLVVVGTGNDQARLQARAVDGVVFTGHLSDGELADVYRRAAFFAMPSTGEGFGLVFLEAMHAGKACLAAPGAAAEILEDDVSGVIVDPADREALTAALVRLFQDEAWRARLAGAAVRRVETHFQPAQLAERLRHCLDVAG